MRSITLEEVRRFEGAVVRLTSTEGEVMIARVLSVSDEYQDVLLDVLSTNQPERYERLGKKLNEAGWVIPFEYILEVQPQDGTGGWGRDQDP